MRDRIPGTLVLAAALVLTLSAVAAEIPPPGRMIDVGGRRMHLDCRGAGSPVVVIDGGSGTWSIYYSHIQKALMNEMRVCTYDRSGLGWSDPSPRPRTSDVIAEELHALLRAAGERPPLLLVGHSFGGYNVRVYQNRYPQDVAGLVLVDAAHEDQWKRLPPEWAAGVDAMVGWMREQAELVRKGETPQRPIQAGGFTKYAPEWREAHLAAQRTPEFYGGLAAENEGALASAKLVPRGSLGNLPVVVLTARRSFDAFAGSGLEVEPANRVWLELQNELAALSSTSLHLYSEHDHALHETDPDAIVNAIRRAARIPTPPPPWLLEHMKFMAEPRGVWITDNRAFLSEQEPSDAYGTEWTWGVGRTTLMGRLFGLETGSETREFWQYRLYWHPAESQAILVQFGAMGIFGIGPMWLEDDGTLRSEMTFYYPGRGRERVRHDLVEVRPDVHRTRSYDWVDGEWKARRDYEWKRKGGASPR